jgi:hypothetical protein
VPAGLAAGRALAPAPPARPAQADPSRDVAQEQLTSVMTTLDRVRAGGRAELREARTPNGQEQAARRLARAHGVAASSLRAVAGAMAVDGSLVRTRQAYVGLARAARLRDSAGFSAARSAVAREETRLGAALAVAVAREPQPTAAPAPPASPTPLALLVVALGLAASGLVLWSRRRPSPPPVVAPAVWTCQISWVASLHGTGFRAVATASGRKPLLVARSPSLALPPFRAPVPEGEALAAARALVRRLLAAGWTPTTRAPHWYSQRFEWAGDQEPAPLPATRSLG